MKIKPFIKDITIIGLLSVALLKTIDISTGILFNIDLTRIRPSKRYIDLRELGTKQNILIKPSKSFLGTTLNLDDKKYSLKLNNDGFIEGGDEYHRSIKNIKDADLYFVGGSTTENLYVSQESRFPTLVGEKLSDSLNRPIKSINAGMSGNNTLHSHLNFLAKGAKYNPKIILIMHNVNDWSTLSRSGSYWNAPISRSIVREFKTESIISTISRSIKDKLIPNTWAIINALKDNKTRTEWDGIYKSAKFNEKHIIKEYELSIMGFIKNIQTREGKVVLMTQPNQLKVLAKNNPDFLRNISHLDPKLMIKLQTSINDKIREISKDNGIMLIDLAKMQNLKNEDYYDSHHLNSKGNKKVAQYITNQLNTNIKFK